MVKMVSNELGHESDLDQEPERPELVATSLSRWQVNTLLLFAARRHFISTPWYCHSLMRMFLAFQQLQVTQATLFTVYNMFFYVNNKTCDFLEAHINHVHFCTWRTSSIVYCPFNFTCGIEFYYLSTLMQGCYNSTMLWTPFTKCQHLVTTLQVHGKVATPVQPTNFHMDY